MKIAPYNQHDVGSSHEPWSVHRLPIYSRPGQRRYAIKRSRFSGGESDLPHTKSSRGRSLSRLKYAGFREDAYDDGYPKLKLRHDPASHSLDSHLETNGLGASRAIEQARSGGPSGSGSFSRMITIVFCV